MIARKSPPKKTNPARKAREFRRTYHSIERVLFVKSLPCIVCGVTPCDNAHVGRLGKGAGRKADYTQIVPLCGAASRNVVGHHYELDAMVGPEEFQRTYGINLAHAMAETQEKWLAWCRIKGIDP